MTTRNSKFQMMRNAICLMTLLIIPFQGHADPSRLCDYSLYSEDGTFIGDRSVSFGALVGSADAVRVGNNGNVIGDIYSGEDVTVVDWAIVDGSVTAAGDIDLNFGGSILGESNPDTPVLNIEIPSYTFEFGDENVNLWPDAELSLDPGDYRDVHAYSRSILTFSTGVYNLRQLNVEADVAAIVFDVTEGPIEINVEELVRIGDRVYVVVVGDPDASLIDIYTNTTGQATIGSDGYFMGTITAPYAHVSLSSRTLAEGALYGKKVTIAPDATIISSGCGDVEVPVI